MMIVGNRQHLTTVETHRGTGRLAAKEVHADEIGDVLGPRPRRDLGRRPDLRDLAVLEDHDAIRERRARRPDRA